MSHRQRTSAGCLSIAKGSRGPVQGFVALSALYLIVLFLIPAVLGQSPRSSRRKPARKPGSERDVQVANRVGEPYPQLVDITQSTGIQFEHLSSPEQKFIVESMSGGVAVVDYDRDGWPDIYFTNALPVFGSRETCKYVGIDVQCGPRGLNGSPDNLYRNNGDGTFTDVSQASGVADPEHRYGLTAVWSDFDNDGKLDLLVANDSQPNYLYRGNGAGKFSDTGFSSGIALDENGAAQANMGIAVGDYRHKGRMPVLVCDFVNEDG